MGTHLKRQKKTRSEAAGWNVGSASEFLGLTDAEAAVVELKLELAKAVREQRPAEDDSGASGTCARIEPITGREDGSGRPVGQYRPAGALAVQAWRQSAGSRAVGPPVAIRTARQIAIFSAISVQSASGTLVLRLPTRSLAMRTRPYSSSNRRSSCTFFKLRCSRLASS